MLFSSSTHGTVLIFFRCVKLRLAYRCVYDVLNWSLEVCQFLNQNFNDNWCVDGRPITWPPNSVNLSPDVLFVWGYIKKCMCAQQPRAIRILGDRTAIFKQITSQMLDKTWKHLAAQYCLYCKWQGGHVESYWYFCHKLQGFLHLCWKFQWNTISISSIIMFFFYVISNGSACIQEKQQQFCICTTKCITER